MNRNHLLSVLFAIIGFFTGAGKLFGGNNAPENPYAAEFILAIASASPLTSHFSPLAPPQDTIPLNDRKGDFINDPNKNPFDLNDPAAVERSVEYDPETGHYIITERIGDDYFRPPTYMTFEEFMDYQSKKQEQDYFNELSGLGGTRSSTGRLDPIGKVDVKNQLIDRLFGGTEVDIRPQGNIDLTFGVEFSNVQNPSFTQRQQRQGGFDFDMAIQMNVEGSIGEKLKLNTNYNTQATFDFDNTMKLDYNTDAFGEDDIIKKIEAGNVSLPLRGSLIQGSQSLFGLKTELQFGRLILTAIASQQKSERENISLQGGSQFQEFEVAADEYDENRHFFLSHYNRNNYEEALSELPQIKTLFKIENIQVWVTDTRNATENIRDIVAIADLGETTRATNQTPAMQPPAVPLYRDIQGEPLPDNFANPIYAEILSEPRTRNVERVVNTLKTPPFSFQQGRDFEKVTARQLSPTEFTYHPNLGFISLNVNIQPDQVVGVAFEYSYGDSVYQVGQIAEDVPQNTDTTVQNVLFVKMLKSTIQPVDLPTWDLMMKNVYSIGAFNVAREDFKLDIFYEDPGAGKKRFLPETNLEGVPLLRVFNLDRLNVQSDPQPDGVFDFVEGITINTRNGRIMFPVLEPFGNGLAKKFTNPADTAKYVFSKLYDETLFNAREFAEFNRFTIEGSYKSSVSSEISLGAFNIPQGSVTVSAGGQILIEGKDYEIDYNIGRVKILNDAVLNSGQPINVSFEDNTLFGFQTKTMLGLRADYKFSEHLTLGGTYLHLFERPFTQKVNIGDDPINNRIFGLDLNYSKEAPWLTKLVDKLPLLSTKEASNITFSAETAALKPGHARAINENSDQDGDKGGIVYLDDFEGSVSSIDLRTPFNGNNGWVMASIPQGMEDMFPESQLKNDLRAGVNRAYLSWYRIDPSVQGNTQNPYETQIEQQEIFPNFTPTQNFGNTFAQILDLQYDPTRRGPYNFDTQLGSAFSKGIDSDGRLVAPGERWGGIMRSLNTNDFQSANIEFIEFWMMSPYLDTLGTGAANPDASNGEMDGYLYLNLGNISEDIMPDSRKFFENGLPGPNAQALRTAETSWGRVPLAQQIVNAFDVDVENRAAQDVGLDGLNDSLEQVKFQSYLNTVQQNGISPDVFAQMQADPSNDNFVHYRDFPDNTPILQRYSRFFGTQGNTPQNTGSQFVTASTQTPDSEDLDGDRTLNETESYFQYRIPIQSDPADRRLIRTDNNPFITESIASADGSRIWYRFRVPLNLLETDDNFQRVGGIRDFRSIRFMRMYLKDFQKPVNLRFATLELVRNQWRRYRQDLGEACFGVEPPEFSDETAFDVNAVNIEENSQRQPFGYALPPGISREQALGVNINALQNEQALSVRVCDLEDGDARGIFKTVNLDMRYFSKLKMFVHGEQAVCDMGYEPVQDDELTVFIRLGSDFRNNFYEYEIPLKISTDVTIPYNDDRYPRVVWPEANDFSIDFELLKQMKLERNASDFPVGKIFESSIVDPNKPEARLSIKGNPNLGLVKAVMVGIRNPKQGPDCDPGDKKSVEIWINEMRVFGLDERGGVAGIARLDMQLADWASVTLSSKASSIGFGALDQQLAERSREQILQYDVATTVALDKFLPEKSGVKLPFYFQYSKETRNPQFDPYDLDIELKDKLRSLDDREEKDSVKQLAQHVTSIKSYNFTNVRKERTNQEKKPMPWDIANFSLTYAFDETARRDPIIAEDVLTRRRGAIDYTFSRQVKYIEPFKKAIKKDKYLKLVKEINMNPLPNSFSFSTDLDRRFNTTRYRFAGEDPRFNTFYNKQFLWNRTYDLQWDLTKNLKFTFNADNRGIIDEPDESLMLDRVQRNPTDPGYIANIKEHRRDSIWSNVRNFGRTKNYRHNLNLSYNLPIRYLPFMEWVTVKASYQANYGWDAASLSPSALSQGNIIRNGQNRQINGDLDFEKLYNYSPYLKKINSKQRPGASGSKDKKADKKAKKGRGGDEGDGGDEGGDTGGKGGDKNDKNSRDEKKDTDSKNPLGRKQGGRPDTDAPGGDPDAADSKGKGGKGTAKKGKDPKDKKDGQPSRLERALIRPLMFVRKARLNYQETFATVVPGYLPNSRLFGMDQFESPGWDFVGGLQPNFRQEDYYSDKDWLHNNWEWITADQLLNQPVTQNVQQQFDAKLTLEPFNDFRIDVEANRNKTKNHSEFFRRNQILGDTITRIQDEWEHLIPKDFGSYTISYSALNTLFEDDLTGLFQKFEESRVIVANRLTNAGPGTHEDSTYASKGYPRGFGPNQQSVVLPAFFAAYTKQDPNTMQVSTDFLNDVVVKLLPRPNWRLTYNGLSKLGFFQDIFQSFSLSHGYKGTLTVSSFSTNLQFNVNDPAKQNPSTFDYYSRFEVPDIQIQESFSPLIGLDMRMKNDMSFKFEYKTNRTLRVEMTRGLQETKGEDFTVGFGYKLKDVKMDFLMPAKKKKGRTKKEEEKKPQQNQGGRNSGGRGQSNAGDLDITFDFSIKDDITTYHAFESGGVELPTRGNRTVSILPQVTYQLNKQLSLRFFFDYRKNVPKTSQGYPTTNVRSGVTVRFSLN
jgi:cell surface protein SprA